MSKKRMAIYFFSVLPIIMVSLVYQKLPTLVPMQWEASGGVRYGDKWQLYIIAGLCLVMGIFMPLVPKIDPRKKNYEKFFLAYENIILMIVIFMAAIMAISLSESLNPGRISIPRVVSGCVGFLFVFLGNMMPKVKSNFFTGVRTPWALSSEMVWNKTQRLGGKVFFFGGLIMILCAWFLPISAMPYIIGCIMCVIVLYPTIMSYIWYKDEAKILEK